MKTHEYVAFFINDFAVRKNLETGNYQVVENIPDYKILVWSDYGNSMYDLEEAKADARKLALAGLWNAGF